MNKEIQICTQNKDRTDLLLLKLFLLEIQAHTKNTNIIYRTLDKKIGPHRIKNRTDFPASNSYYYYLTARNTDTHKSTKNTDTKYGTLKKEIQTYILKEQGRPSCPKLLPLEIQTHEEEETKLNKRKQIQTPNTLHLIKEVRIN